MMMIRRRREMRKLRRSSLAGIVMWARGGVSSVRG